MFPKIKLLNSVLVPLNLIFYKFLKVNVIKWQQSL